MTPLLLPRPLQLAGVEEALDPAPARLYGSPRTVLCRRRSSTSQSPSPLFRSACSSIFSSCPQTIPSFEQFVVGASSSSRSLTRMHQRNRPWLHSSSLHSKLTFLFLSHVSRNRLWHLHHRRLLHRLHHVRPVSFRLFRHRTDCFPTKHHLHRLLPSPVGAHLEPYRSQACTRTSTPPARFFSAHEWCH